MARGTLSGLIWGTATGALVAACLSLGVSWNQIRSGQAAEAVAAREPAPQSAEPSTDVAEAPKPDASEQSQSNALNKDAVSETATTAAAENDDTSSERDVAQAGAAQSTHQSKAPNVDTEMSNTLEGAQQSPEIGTLSAIKPAGVSPSQQVTKPELIAEASDEQPSQPDTGIARAPRISATSSALLEDGAIETESQIAIPQRPASNLNGADTQVALLRPEADDAPVAAGTTDRPALPEPELQPLPEVDNYSAPAPAAPSSTTNRTITSDLSLARVDVDEAPAASPTPNAPKPASEANSTNDDAASASDTDQVTETETPSALRPATSSLPTIGQDADERVASVSTTGRIRSNDRASRLPTVRVAPEAEDENASTQPSSGLAPEEPGKFENPDGKPLYAIVLIDEGQPLDSGDTQLQALKEFPFPISVAVDASAADAGARAEEFRNAGLDVLAMIDLQPELTASDIEVSMSALLAPLGAVAGILEGTETGLQAGREMSDQVTQIAAAEGLGIIWQPKGLDTAQKLAAREGIPSKTIFRDFDGSGQNARAMTRFLQNAAVRADQEGGVVMLGRLRAETVSAILTWGVQERSGRIALAPISATLDVDAK